MAEITIMEYSSKYNERWDDFVLLKSTNGTFQQTRRFLNYHPADRFVDNSLMFLKGSEIIAVLPANIILEDNKKVLCSHQGSTFGGIVIEKNNIKVSVLSSILDELDKYCIKQGICKLHLKMTSQLYAKDKTELIDYMLFNRGYKSSLEVGYFVDFDNYKDDILSNYSSSVRRHYKASVINGLSFCELRDRKGIELFYDVLLDNYQKFDTLPVHSLEDLYLLKEKILGESIRFFGVYKEEDVVAASMVFDFNHSVFHTQYLASRLSHKDLYVNEYLYTNLIATAKKEGFHYLSFGTATLEGGKILNYNLAQYKEQYGTDQYVNCTYHKFYEEDKLC